MYSVNLYMIGEIDYRSLVGFLSEYILFGDERGETSASSVESVTEAIRSMVEYRSLVGFRNRFD